MKYSFVVSLCYDVLDEAHHRQLHGISQFSQSLSKRSNSMESIMIVEAFSTGVNLITDCVRRGYHPLVLYPQLPANAESVMFQARAAIKQKYASVADFFDEADRYEDTLALVRSLHPKLILVGSEYGVDLATHLSDDLGLPGNPYARIGNYIHKDEQQAALVKYGIRAICGRIVRSEEDALSYYHEKAFRGCVLKPVRGAGSVGVYMCENEDDIRTAFRKITRESGFFGISKDGVLMQEKITGTEYIVNTVSCKGVHRISSIWKYHKIEVEGGHKLYDYAISVNHLETGSNRLIQYAFDVADAIGYEYGAIHGEYMVDEHGPVLIEANCRPMGAGLPASFADRIWGHHETDTILDSYLNPEWHIRESAKPYRAYAKGIIKILISLSDRRIQAAPILGIARRLRSYHSAVLGSVLQENIVRTVDLETSPGTVFLVNEDEYAATQDLEFLRKIEHKYYDMMFTAVSTTVPSGKTAGKASVSAALQDLHLRGSILVLTCDPESKCACVIADGESIMQVSGGFDWGILDLGSGAEKDVETMIEDFYNLVSRLRVGGHLLVPASTFSKFPSGIESVEILCESIGLCIEAPSRSMGTLFMATVENSR
jgi:biotin carboxylase